MEITETQLENSEIKLENVEMFAEIHFWTHQQLQTYAEKNCNKNYDVSLRKNT